MIIILSLWLHHWMASYIVVIHPLFVWNIKTIDSISLRLYIVHDHMQFSANLVIVSSKSGKDTARSESSLNRTFGMSFHGIFQNSILVPP